MRSIEEIKLEIASTQKSGDYLKEYDLASAALSTYPNEEFFQYCFVLALARCNAQQRALDFLYSYKLHLSNDEYVRSLEARILKNLAFLSLETDTDFSNIEVQKFHTAAVTYHREFNVNGGHYSAINAATLYLLSGDHAKSQELAHSAIQIALEDSGPKYFGLVTLAESYLLLNRIEVAQQVIIEASKYNKNNLLARAKTHSQLKLICNYLGFSTAILNPLLPDTVIHYCGHAFYNHCPLSDKDETALVEQIHSVISNHHCSVAYGSLMAGSDIMIAEAILKSGGELNVWLPFNLNDFCDLSVRPAGEHWVKRFYNCIENANSVNCATESEFLGDASLFNFCSDVTMGMAIMRANSLHTKVMQVAIWDQNTSSKTRGTYSNILKWQKLGKNSEIIQCFTIFPTKHLHKTTEEYPINIREPHAILFSDMRGYSKLCDRDILWYFNKLQPILADVITQFQSEIEHLDTWGDAIFLVTEKASTAAKIAIALNDAINQIDQTHLDLKEPLLMRIGLHFGPVYKIYDHLMKCYTYSSHDVTKTARIEPVTPPGEIFGTEPFIAMLELEGEGWANYEYAGSISSAKNFGAFRMFHIRTRHQSTNLVCSLNQASL
jgi:class 3 adenylate cyclase